MSEVVIKQSLKKQLILVFLGIIMLVMSSTCVIAGFMGDNIFYLAIGIIGILFFGACFLFIIHRLINPKPILIINEKGIIDNSAASSVGEIAWEEIDSFYESSLFGNKFICVRLKDNKKTLSRLNPWKARISKWNKSLGYEEVSITLQSADVNLIEVLNLLQNRIKEYKNNEAIRNHVQSE